MITLEDVKKLLVQGKEHAEIRRLFFRSIDDDLHSSFSGSGLNMPGLTTRLKDIGINLNQLPYKNDVMGKPWWTVKLKNTTITISQILHPTIRLFPDNGAYDWYLKYINPEKIIDAIKEADMNYPRYLQIWADYEKEITKFSKVRVLSEVAIENVVKEKLRGTGIEYNLVFEPTDVLLKIKMRRSRYFEVKLPHKDFSDILTDTLIDDIRKVSSLLNGMRYTCKIQRFGPTIKWLRSE